MSNHTSGPWLVSEYGDYGDYDGECRVVLGEGGDIRTAIVLGLDTAENRANAHLIAASPDLLAEAKALVEKMKGWGSVHESHFVGIEQAIAKAEGGEA
jgi:hypothetical protein